MSSVYSVDWIVSRTWSVRLKTSIGSSAAAAPPSSAVAVNPDSELRAVARSRGWTIRDFRTGRKAAKIGVPTVAAAALAGGLAGGAIALRRRDKLPW